MHNERENMGNRPLALSGSIFCAFACSTAVNIIFLTAKHFPSVLLVLVYLMVCWLFWWSHISFNCMSWNFIFTKLKKKSVLVSYASDLIYIFFFCTRQMGNDWEKLPRMSEFPSRHHIKWRERIVWACDARMCLRRVRSSLYLIWKPVQLYIMII